MFAAIASVVTWFWGAYATYNKLPVVFHGICDFVAGMAVMWLWKTLAVVVCVLALAGAASAISPQTADPNEPPPQILKASVRVDVPQGRGVTHSGSGTVVAAYVDASGKAACVVLTNKHVCPTGNCPVKVTWPWDTFASDAVWLGCDDRADLAAVACFAPDDLAVCPPADASPSVGEVLHQCGYPRCKGPVVRRGPVLPSATFQVDVRSVEGSPTLSGDSGSGLFNRRGELVGVNWGGHGQVGSSCHAVSLHDVRRFLAVRPKLAKLFPGLRVACPVHGEHCPCGCRTDGTCNCAPPRPVFAPVFAPAFGGNCSGGNCRSR